MSELKPLVIGDLVAPKPVIQGGMGVGISLHNLAGAVAKAGVWGSFPQPRLDLGNLILLLILWKPM